MKKYLKKENGVTMIALIVTIIVILILAGVSIGTLTTDNGIISQAKNAKEKAEVGDIIDKAKVSIAKKTLEEERDITESEFDEILNKYGTISGEGEDKFITTEKKYNIKATDIYDGPFSKEDDGVVNKGGVTIDQLYDECNDPNDTANYDDDAMHIGDYVTYTANVWGESKNVPTIDNPFEFGGYEKNQSRDNNALGGYPYLTTSEGNYKGWRIWDISDDKSTITLISAGCPEVYYHPSGANKAYISEYILTGNVNDTVKDLSLGLGTTYVKRNWTMYENENLYATTQGARVMSKSDLDTWYNKNIDSTVTNTAYAGTFLANTQNKLMSVIQNDFYYWLCSGFSSLNMYCVNGASGYVSNDNGQALGVRILVPLTSDVKFNEIPEKLQQDGFTYNKWTIQ